MVRCTCKYCKGRLRSNPQRICASCEELKPHYSHKLCYLCYRKLQCRWIEDIDEWFDSLEKPQCQNLMHKMGFCKKHWKHIEQKERERKNRDAEKRRNPGTPELIEYKIQRAMTKARELEGWDVFSTSREQNLNLLEEDLRTVAARFWLKETAWDWVRYADGDKNQVQRWIDERFGMPCYLALVEYHFDG